ncbi:Gx transporter family protein [Selenomonadales bacterium OttesenSCG-928-I06]|nr:Gx transporter family protein [Selenomonadales bacterium OttesenSCG-928-I06]
MSKVKRIIILALLVAIASILHVVEGWFPIFLAIPGAKIGLANIISLYAILNLGLKDTLYIVIARVIIGSLFGASFLGPAFIMSFGGSIASVIAMHFALKTHPLFSIFGISIIGAVTHNIVQVMLASVLISSTTILWYIPYLTFFAIFTGFITGLITKYLNERIPKELYISPN